jgi:hypothetical protein
MDLNFTASNHRDSASVFLTLHAGRAMNNLIKRKGFFPTWNGEPFLGVVSTMFGFLLCVASIPNNVEPAGQMRLAGAMMALGLLFPLVCKLFQSPASLFYPVAIVAISPIYWLLLDLIQGSYDLVDVTQTEVLSAMWCITLFSTGVWIGSVGQAIILPKSILNLATVNLSSNTLFAIAIVAFCLAFSRFAIPSGFNVTVMLSAFSVGRWEAAWARGAEGGWDAIIDHLSYFGYMLPSIGVLLAKQEGWLSWRTITIFFFSCIILALLSTGGGRRVIGVILGSAGCTWFLSSQKPTWIYIVLIATFFAVVLLFMQIMLLYRNDGLSRIWSEGPEVRLTEQRTLHVDDNFLRLSQITGIVPQNHPHTTWRWLLWVAVRPVPRVIWPEKPKDPGFNLPDHLGKKGVSLSMSAIGELYLGFGYIGCAVGGLFWGRLARILATLLSNYRTNGSIVVFSAGLFALFAGMRSAIELVLMSYVILAWLGLVAIITHLSHQKASSRGTRSIRDFCG